MERIEGVISGEGKEKLSLPMTDIMELRERRERRVLIDRRKW